MWAFLIWKCSAAFPAGTGGIIPCKSSLGPVLVFTQVLDLTPRARRCSKVCREVPRGTRVSLQPGKGTEPSAAFCLTARSAVLSRETSILEWLLKFEHHILATLSTGDSGVTAGQGLDMGHFTLLLLKEWELLAFWPFLAWWINHLDSASFPLTSLTSL